MKFDATRMARLAGLGTNSTNLIAEAGNRSMREDDGLSGEDEARFGKGHINEEDLDDADLYDEDDIVEGEEEEEDVDEIAWGPIGAAIGSAAIGVGAGYAGEKLAQNEDIVYEINESMLRDEINRMRKARSQNVNEAKLRSVVRDEIANTLKEMLENDDESLNNDGSWIYGNNKPKRSKKGHVTVGAFGIGFE
jgi:hypothetical protein